MVGARFELRFEALKGISVLFLLVYKMMIGSSKIAEKIIWENTFEQRKKKPGINLTPG